LILSLTLFLPLLAVPAAAQEEREVPGWYRESSLFINIDSYSQHFDVAHTDRYKAQVRDMLERTRPDVIYYHCSSQDGYTKYPTNTGMRHPNLGDNDIIRVWREITGEMGIRFFAYVSYHMARAVTEAHPEYARVNRRGERTDRPCSNSAYVEESLLPKMEELVTEYDVDGFWVDATIWAITPCYCDNCVTGFKEHYGFAPPRSQQDTAWKTYTAFLRESFERESRKISDAIHDLKPEVVYVPNYANTIYQPEKVPYYVDAISGDVGHDRRSQMVSFKSRFKDTQGVPWDIMLGVRYALTVSVKEDGEFEIHGPFGKHKPGIEGEVEWFGLPRSEEYLQQESAIIGSNGGITSLFVHNKPNSELSPSRTNVMAEVAGFVHEREEVFNGTEPLRDIGILHSAPTFYREGDGLSHLQPVLDRLEGAHIALTKLNYHVNLFADYSLEERLDAYRTVVISQQTRLDKATAEAIRGYVRGGGSVVVAGKVAMEDVPGNRVQSELEDVLGIRYLDRDPLKMTYLPYRGAPMPVLCEWYPVETTTAEAVLPMWKDKWEERDPEVLPWPAMTVNEYGEGRAVYIAGDLFTGYFRNQFFGVLDIVEQAMTEADTQKPFSTDAPIAVEFSLRKKEGDLIVHMVNRLVDWDMDSKGAIWTEHVPPVDRFDVEVKCAARPEQVLLQPGDVEVDWSWSGGTATVEVPGVHIHRAIVLEGVYR